MKRRIPLLLAIFVVLLIPSMGQDQPFSFIMLTDPQFGMYESDKGFARETANYEFAIAAVNRLKPGFVIILGDLVNKAGDKDQLSEFLRISSKIDPSIPVHYVAGNHDVGHEPTSEKVAAYREKIGPDYYSFRTGPVYGIVLNSTLILAPQKADQEYQAQNAWLKKELATAKESGASQIIVFQHHPYFTKDAAEPDDWGNVPVERRKPMLEMLRAAGVHYVFAGHTHMNHVAKDGDLEVIACGPAGMPFGSDGSGLRLAIVKSGVLQHRYFEFGKLPDRLEIK